MKSYPSTQEEENQEEENEEDTPWPDTTTPNIKQAGQQIDNLRKQLRKTEQIVISLAVRVTKLEERQRGKEP